MTGASKPHSIQDDFRLVESACWDAAGDPDLETRAALRRIEEQYQTALDRLWEAHDQLCGCDKPADEGRCSAPEETWGAFEYLGERERVSSPATSSEPPDSQRSRLDVGLSNQDVGTHEGGSEVSSPAKEPGDA